MMHFWRSACGLARSCRIYYGDHTRSARMDALYSTFVGRGDLVFDIGAHVGDRTASFRRLGARVVSLEPQPWPALLLRLLYGLNRNVTVVQSAVGREEGTLELRINPANPTVSTASDAFIAASKHSPSWRDQVWSETRRVTVTTLDRLIAIHGVPKFTKIDVEGFEAEVLSGLTQALPALSFEFTTIQMDVAIGCVQKLSELGEYDFNAAFGENQCMVFAKPVESHEMASWLQSLPSDVNSGDVYARIKTC